MSNPHDVAGHAPVEGIIPAGSLQDRVLELTAVLALFGLCFWGWQMSEPIAVEHGGAAEHATHAAGHNSQHAPTEHTEEHAE